MAVLAVSEAQLHKAVVQYLTYALPPDAVFLHVPNEGKRGWKAQAALKRTGTLKGAPDLIVCWRGTTTFIELKSTKGVISVAQRVVHARLRDAGFWVFVCRSLDQVYEDLALVGVPLRSMAGVPYGRSP